jgi:hypothetical protein
MDDRVFFALFFFALIAAFVAIVISLMRKARRIAHGRRAALAGAAPGDTSAAGAMWFAGAPSQLMRDSHPGHCADGGHFGSCDSGSAGGSDGGGSA